MRALEEDDKTDKWKLGKHHGKQKKERREK